MLAVVEGFGAKDPAEVASLRARVDKKLLDKRGNKTKLWASEKPVSRKTSAHQVRM